MPNFKFSFVKNSKKRNFIDFITPPLFACCLFAGISAAEIAAQAVQQQQQQTPQPQTLPSPTSGGNNIKKGAGKSYSTVPLKRCWTKDKITRAFLASDNAEQIDIDKNLFFYFSNADERFQLEYADKTDARRIWAVGLGGEMVSDLSSDGENIFLLIKTEEKYFLKSISRLTGVTNWRSSPLPLSADAPESFVLSKNEELPRGSGFFLHTYEDKIIVFAYGGQIFSYGRGDGRIIWKTRLEKSITSAPAFEKNLAAVGTVGETVILSLSDGTEIKRLKAFRDGVVTAVIFLYGGAKIAFGDKRGNVGAADLTNGKTYWSIRGGGEITGISRTASSGLLVSSLDNFVYLLSPEKNRRLWKRRLAGRILYKPLILGKYAVVINSSDPRADIFELDDGKLVNQIVFETGNYFTGDILSDGNLLLMQTAYGIRAFSAREESVCGESGGGIVSAAPSTAKSDAK